MMGQPFEVISLLREPALLKALAWYREALNAGSPFYRFFSYWNSLEAVLGSAANRASFVDRKVAHFAHLWDTTFPMPSSPSRHFHELSRNAIAHVLRTGRPMIDPDADRDRRRIDSESRFLDYVARAAIQETFPHPISAGRSPS
jgi:hypothetical protein